MKKKRIEEYFTEKTIIKVDVGCRNRGKMLLNFGETYYCPVRESLPTVLGTLQKSKVFAFTLKSDVRIASCAPPPCSVAA